MWKKIFIINKTEIIHKIAQFILKLALENVSQNNVFNMALSGGSTPAPLYKYLAAKMKKTFPWESTHIFLVDERCVPLLSKDRNYSMIKETIFDNIKIRAENIHNMPDDLSDPVKSAIKYEEELNRHFNKKIPEFDFILLGIGNDGHTASLFPENKNGLEENKSLVIDVYAPSGNPPGHRLSLTYKVLNNSKNILFFVTGSNKKEIIYDILINKNEKLPATSIKPKGNLLWFIDSEAGELIKNLQ